MEWFHIYFFFNDIADQVGVFSVVSTFLPHASPLLGKSLIVFGVRQQNRLERQLVIELLVLKRSDCDSKHVKRHDSLRKKER